MIRPEPCFNCGARASCRHREVDDVELPVLKRAAHVRPGNVNNPWGAKGNPAGKARQRMIDMLKAQAFK